MHAHVVLTGFLLPALLFARTTMATEPAALVPLPAEVTWPLPRLPGGGGHFQLGPVIAADPACKATAAQLAEMLHPATGIEFQIVALDGNSRATPSITLKEDKSLAAVSKEAYRLNVTPDGVTITGASPAGVFYGAQTLRQLLPLQIYATSRQTGVEWNVPCVEIVDRPRFAWRGFMLDDSRHFLGADFVKRLIDLMAMHKLNLLHWHLSDDDGFRIEIKSYPKLTEIGAWRGTRCELPNTRHDEKHPETYARYGGFYTQQQIREIVAYAAARHVDIMPEIDVPGHSGAAAVAYPEILCEGKKSGDVWCAGREENYRMLDAMLGELAELFPFEYIHVGGDEVNPKAWANCPRCKALMKQQNLSKLDQIQRYFTHRYEEIARKHGRKMIGWNEILNPKLSKDSAIMSWTGLDPGYRAAAGGWNVVFAAGPHCYFDMKEAARDTWGHNWAGIIPLSQVYAFDPFAGAPASRLARRNPGDAPREPSLTEEQKPRVLGVEACLWTEFITSNDRADYKIWPRLCALAELAWTPQPRRKFQEFMDRLGPTHLQRLGLMGVAYRVPDPEFIPGDAPHPGNKETGVRIQPPFAGAEIHYTTDGGKPTTSSLRFNGEPIRIQGTHPVAAQVFLPGERTSHIVMDKKKN